MRLPSCLGIGAGSGVPFTPEDRSAMAMCYGRFSEHGNTTLDVYLNERAFWHYKLRGHQVLKKWPLCWERNFLGRVLRIEEIMYFAEVGRRIGKILGLNLGASSELEAD